MLRLTVLVVLFAVGEAAQLPYHGRIIGGKVTTIEEFPYQVSIEDLGQHKCGGSIYTPRHIVTAAHCLAGVFEPELRIRVGSTHRERGGRVYDAEEILSPEGFLYSTLENDVAIITLNESITYGPGAQPINLVPENHEPQHGEMMIATGWGPNECMGIPARAAILRTVRLPVIRRDMCSTVYKHVKITDKMICAGGGNERGILSSDSGGPLVNKKGELAGIISFSRAGSKRGYPAVFTNVANPSVQNFIKDNSAT